MDRQQYVRECVIYALSIRHLGCFVSLYDEVSQAKDRYISGAR
jgi:hypothetical protein